MAIKTREQIREDIRNKAAANTAALADSEENNEEEERQRMSRKAIREAIKNGATVADRKPDSYNLNQTPGVSNIDRAYKESTGNDPISYMPVSEKQALLDSNKKHGTDPIVGNKLVQQAGLSNLTAGLNNWIDDRKQKATEKTTKLMQEEAAKQAEADKKYQALSNEQKQLLDKYADSKTLYQGGVWGANSSVMQEAASNSKKVRDELVASGLSEEDITSLVDYASRKKNKSEYEASKEGLTKEVGSSNIATKAGLDLTSVLAQPIGAVVGASDALSLALGRVPDYNDTLHQAGNIANDIRSARTENMKTEAGQMIYNGVMSGVDNLYVASGLTMGLGELGVGAKTAQALSGGIITSGYGLSSFSNSFAEAIDKGLPEDNAIMLATANGIAEAATEYIGIELLIDALSSSDPKVKLGSILLQMLVQMGCEGSEEVVNTVVSNAADILINGKYSDYEKNVAAYGEQVAKDIFKKEIVTSGITGAIGGAVGMGGTTAVRLTTNSMNATTMLKNQNYSELAESIDTDEASYDNEQQLKEANMAKDKAKELAAKQEAGKKITVEDQRQMYELMGIAMENASNSNKAIAKESITVPETETIEVPEQYQEKGLDSVEEVFPTISEANTVEELARAYKKVLASKDEVKNHPDLEAMIDLKLGLQKATRADLNAAMKAMPSAADVYKAAVNGKMDEYTASKYGDMHKAAYFAGAKVYNEKYASAISQAKEVAKSVKSAAVTVDGKSVVANSFTDDGLINTSSGAVDISNVSFKDAAVGRIYNAAASYSAPIAKMYVENVPENVPANSYIRYMDQAFRMGQQGNSWDATKAKSKILIDYVSEDVVKKMWEEGQSTEKAQDEKTEAKRDKNVYKKGSGKVINEKNIDTPLMPLYEAIAAATGIDVKLDDSIDVRGAFNKGLSEIIFNPNDKAATEVYFHEITEFIEAYNPESMSKVYEAIMDYLTESDSEWVQKRIDDYVKAYASKEGSKTIAEASKEFVNDSVVGMFVTPEGMSDFLNYTIENKGEAETRSIVKTITDFLGDLINKLKSILTGTKLSKQAMKVAQMQADQVADLRSQWLDALRGAVEAYNNELVAKTDEYINSTDANLLAFINTVRAGKHVQNNAYVLEKQLNTRLSNAIESLVGFNVSDYSNEINDDQIRHNNKRHGEKGKADHSMKNPEDLARIEFVMQNFDRIYLVGTDANSHNSDGSDALLVKLQMKTADGFYYVVEAVPDSKRHKLVFKDAYKNKKDTFIEEVNAFSPDRNALSDPLYKVSFEDIISSDRNSVNVDDIAYHAGDLGKAEFYWQQGSGRGTGHFGTGTYFVGNEEKINIGNYANRPHHAVDFSNYNLYKVSSDKEAYDLHNALKVIDGGVNRQWIEPAFNNEFRVVNTSEYFDIIEKRNDYSDASQISALQQFANNHNIEYTSLEDYMADEGYDNKEDAEAWYADDLKNEIWDKVDKINAEYNKFLDVVFDYKFRYDFANMKDALYKVADYQENTPKEYKRRDDSLATVFMKALGFDGVDVRGTSLDNTEFGSVIYDLNPESVRYSIAVDESGLAPIFTSKMLEEIDNIKQAKLGAASVVNYLKGKGVKDEEIKWSGIAEFIEGKKSVTKEELQQFAASSLVNLEEKTLVNSKEEAYDDFFNDVSDLYDFDYGDFDKYFNYDNEFVYNTFKEDVDALLDEGEINETDAYNLLEYAKQYDSGNYTSTKWGEYVTEGTSNYREMLFKMPGSDYSNEAMKTHWGEKGVLAHARIDDMILPDGSKMLFIEEIQSDWHNAGSNKGYATKSQKATAEELRSKANDIAGEIYQNFDYSYGELNRFDEAKALDKRIGKEKADNFRKLRAEMARLRSEAEQEDERYFGMAVDAPFKTTYTDYVMKRLIRLAAEGDYDYIGWTTGSMQEARWSSEYAEGYRIEYDQDIPKFVNKYGKQWGVKTDDVETQYGDIVHAVAINDSMKDSVLTKGQYMYSLDVDSEGNELSEGQKKYFEGVASVDSEGRLQAYYTGSPETYDVFDIKKARSSGLNGKGFYFTTSKDGAALYGNVTKEYLRFYNPLTDKKTITRDQFVKFVEAVAEDEDYGIENYGYGATVDSVVNTEYSEDKSDYEMIKAIDLACIGDTVAAVKLFNEVNGTDFDAIVVPNETVVWEANRIKDADNLNPTESDNRHFSLEVPVEEARDLIAVHNMYERDLLGTIELGGFPMPSIAIVRANAGHNDFGNISIVFNKETIDPKSNKSNKVYSADAYTPTFPLVEYNVNEDYANDLYDKMMDLTDKGGAEMINSVYFDPSNLRNKLTNMYGIDSVIESYKNNIGMKQAYLAETDNQVIEYPKKEVQSDKSPEYKKLYQLIIDMGIPEDEDARREFVLNNEQKLRDAITEAFTSKFGETKARNLAEKAPFLTLRTRVNEAYKYMQQPSADVKVETDFEAGRQMVNDRVDQAAYEKWLDDLLRPVLGEKGIRNDKELYLPSGKRRSWSALHDEYKLENIVKAMKTGEQTGVSFGGASIYGAAQQTYNSIDEIRAAKDRLHTISDEDFNAKKMEFVRRFSELEAALANNPGGVGDAGEVMCEAISRFTTKSGIANYIKKEGAGWTTYSDYIVDDLLELVDDIRNMPTNYFEAKPQRAVGLDEIAYVVLPDNVSSDVVEALDNAGIKHVSYIADDTESRLEALNSDEAVRFSIEVPEEAAFSDLRRSVGVDSVNDNAFDFSTASILEAGAKVLKGQDVDTGLVERIANKYIKQTGSTYDAKLLADNLSKVFAYLQTEEYVNYSDLDKLISEVALPVIEQSYEKDPEQKKQYDEFRRAIKSYKFKLTDTQKKAVAEKYGTLTNFKQKNRKYLNFSDTGVETDAVWSELQELSGYTLSDVADPDQPLALIDAIEAMEPQLISAWHGNEADAAKDLSMQIMSDYYKANNAKEAAVDFEIQAEAYRQAVDRIYARKFASQIASAARTNTYDADEEARINTLAKEDPNHPDVVAYEATKLNGENTKLEDLIADKAARAISGTHKVTATSEKNAAAIRSASRNATRHNQNMDEREEMKRSELKKSINRVGGQLLTMLNNPTDKKHVPEGLKKPVAEFVASIDFISSKAKPDSKNTMKWQEKMKALQDMLVEMTSGESDDKMLNYMGYTLDADLADNMKDFLKKYGSYARVANLDSNGLKELNRILTGLRVQINKINATYANKKYEHIDELVNASFKDMNAKKTRMDKNAVSHWVKDHFMVDMMDSVTFFEVLGDAPVSVYDELREGFNVRTKRIDEGSKWYAKMLADNDITEGFFNTLTGKKATVHKFEVNDGSIELTTAQLMELYCLMQREQARLHILKGGIRVGHIEGKYNDQLKAVHPTAKQIDDMLSVLTDKQKDLCDKMQQYLSTDVSDWGNKVTLEAYGYAKFNEKHYWPIKSDSNSLAANDKNIGDNVSLNAIKNMSASKATVEGASNAIMINDVFDTFSNHIASMATYEGLMLPLSDAMQWYNYLEKHTGASEDGATRYDSTIKSQIERIYGKRGQQWFIQFMKNINGDAVGAMDKSILSYFTSNYKAAAVSANLRVIVQQPTAFVRAMNEMDSKYLLGALGSTGDVFKLAAKAKDNSMIAKWKGWGYFENMLGKSMKQVITNQYTVIEKIKDKGAVGAQMADDLTWGMLYRAVELEIEDTTDLKPNTKAFDTAVAKRFDYIIDHTQVVDSTFHRSALMRSKSEINQMLTAFMMEPTKSYNMLFRAFASGDKKKIQRALLTYLLNAIAVSAAAAIIDAFRADDDKTSWIDRYTEALTQNTLDNVNPINMVPVFKEIMSAVEGYDPARMDVGFIFDSVGAMQQIAKAMSGDSKKTPYGLYKVIAKAFSEVTGIPLSSANREIEVIYNNFGDLFGLDNLATTKQASDAYKGVVKSIDNGGDITTEVKDLLDQAEDKDATATKLKTYLTREYKPKLIELYNSDMTAAIELKKNLIKAYVAAGDTNDKANKKINEWFKQ